jgi:hypothetical protein
VQGAIEATKETGGNAAEVVTAAADGALEAASTLGHTAVQAVTDVLVDVVEGVKEVLAAVWPTGASHADTMPEPSTTESGTEKLGPSSTPESETKTSSAL